MRKFPDAFNLIIEQLKSDERNTPTLKKLLSVCFETLAKIEDDNLQKKLLRELIERYVILERKVDILLKNTLPETIAEDIKYKGRFLPRPYRCTILFTDFVRFTKLAEQIQKEVLIDLLDIIFKGFDDIVSNLGGTKIKTIGDAYMAVFGAPI
jgi:hypothetical protein